MDESILLGVLRMRINGGRACGCGLSAGNWRAQDGSLSETGLSPKQREPGQAFYI